MAPCPVVPFYDESSASNINSAEGVLGTPRPIDNFSPHILSLRLVDSHLKSYRFAETGSGTALILLGEWGQLMMIQLLCFC